MERRILGGLDKVSILTAAKPTSARCAHVATCVHQKGSAAKTSGLAPLQWVHRDGHDQGVVQGAYAIRQGLKRISGLQDCVEGVVGNYHMSHAKHGMRSTL